MSCIKPIAVAEHYLSVDNYILLVTVAASGAPSAQ